MKDIKNPEDQEFSIIKSQDYSIEESQDNLRIIIIFPENVRTYKDLLYLNLFFAIISV